LLVTITAGLLLTPVTAALAQAPSGEFTNPIGDTSFEGIIRTIIRFMLSLVGLLALGSLIWGGVLYIVSLGNDDYVKQAKKIIFWAIIGLVVVSLAFVIISTVSRFLGNPVT